jgi:hypothetical protein
MICFESFRGGQRTLNAPEDSGAGALRYRALSIGSAVSSELSSAGLLLRVHSVFASTVNLDVVGSGKQVALRGPSGSLYPHAVALEWPLDFRNWQLTAGSPAQLADGSLRMRGRQFALAVDLNGAHRRPLRSLPAIGRLTSLCRACSARVAAIQAAAAHDLRLDALLGLGRAMTKPGQSLQKAALALGSSARTLGCLPNCAVGMPFRPGSAARLPLWQSVSALVGLGNGLTPAGDDFLCGFLAAARTRCLAAAQGSGLLETLCAAVEGNLAATGEVSASLLKWAILDHWPEPLLDLADAIAVDRWVEALRAVDDLCRFGHASGADMASGFLFGLYVLSERAQVALDGATSAAVETPGTCPCDDCALGMRLS